MWRGICVFSQESLFFYYSVDLAYWSLFLLYFISVSRRTPCLPVFGSIFLLKQHISYIPIIQGEKENKHCEIQCWVSNYLTSHSKPSLKTQRTLEHQTHTQHCITSYLKSSKTHTHYWTQKSLSHLLQTLKRSLSDPPTQTQLTR